jgi:nucleoside-diphosphate-sugar epimerase
VEEIEALIGRSADFYGPKAVNSILYISFLEEMLRGKKPQLVFPTDVPHTFSYTEDNAKALVDLATNPSVYGEVWHLPVGKPITLEEVQSIFNKNLNTNLKASVLPKPMIEILKLFISPLREVSEMIYQFKTPYIMSDAKFISKFPNFKTTSYEEGISKMVNSFKI